MRTRIAVTLVTLAAGAAAAQRTDTVVRTATAPVHAGVAELRREIAVGVIDGSADYMLGAIDDIAVTATGTMYVLDKSIPAVRVYDAAGKFVRNIGRLGSGPGEIRSAAGIALAKNGNLLLWDFGNARVNVYSPTGDAITSWPTTTGSGSASGRNLIVTDTAGFAYVRTRIYTRGGQRLMPAEEAWLRFAADGVLRDTVYPPTSAAIPLLTLQNGGFYMSAGVPFAPAYFTELSPLGYFVSGLASRIAIDLHERGRPLTSIRRDVALQSVSSRERDSARAEITERFRKNQPNWSWNGPDIPRTKAAYTRLWAADDGRLWVQLASGPSAPDDPSAPGASGGRMGAGRGPGGRGPGWSCPSHGWSLSDVYEPSGRYLGQVRIPEKVSAIVMRGDFIWAATCNDEDAPQVVRYRIAWR